MRAAIIRNSTRAAEVAAECLVADSFWKRLRGLLGQPALCEGQGLLITPCRAVHMMGMKYPLDVVFLDPAGQVVGIESRLPPRAKSAWYPRAHHALELPAGTLERSGTRLGDIFNIEYVQRENRVSEPREDEAAEAGALSVTGAA